MSLRESQSKFVNMVSLLVSYARLLGYELTYSDTYATNGHREGSFHYKRLAVDFNLFKDGTYLTSTSDHLPLGEFWEFIGGSWGGRFKNQDGNHYSLGE